MLLVMRSVYFDYNATTPLDAEVRAAMLPFMDSSLDSTFGNPSSVHHIGRRARSLLDDARDRVSKVLTCKPSEIIFTAGGSESNNLAIFGTARLLREKGRHLITSAVEHHAVLHCVDYLERYEGFEITRLPVSREGFVNSDDVRRAIRKDTTLVSIMAANNETGSIMPVAEIGAICREAGVLFHTDAVQWFCKQPFANIDQFNADLVSICAHKFHGPKGAGALFIRSPLLPLPILFGGAHENERRAGTENLAAIIGLTEALERFVKKPVFDPAKLSPFTNKIRAALPQIPGVTIVSPAENCLANTLSFVVERADSIALLAGLDLEGICASSGSACTAGSIEPSHVISALGYPPELANALVRFSLGRESTAEEVDYMLNVLPKVLGRVRSSP